MFPYGVVCREDFDPEKVDNQAALGLLQRFVSNGREADGQPTRDRLKIIPRCVAVLASASVHHLWLYTGVHC